MNVMYMETVEFRENNHQKQHVRMSFYLRLATSFVAYLDFCSLQIDTYVVIL